MPLKCQNTLKRIKLCTKTRKLQFQLNLNTDYFYTLQNNEMNVFWVLNSHCHVMYILSILLAKYVEVKVSLKSRKTTAVASFDAQGLTINTMHFKTFHALKVLPDTTRI